MSTYEELVDQLSRDEMIAFLQCNGGVKDDGKWYTDDVLRRICKARRPPVREPSEVGITRGLPLFGRYMYDKATYIMDDFGSLIPFSVVSAYYLSDPEVGEALRNRTGH